jgi:hypothetical protein
MICFQVRLIGVCQSSVDFVEHLRTILSDQNAANLELAKQTEIQYLIERFNKLLSEAHSREQHFRDVRYVQKTKNDLMVSAPLTNQPACSVY